MKGFHIRCISLFIIIQFHIPVYAQEIELADTLRSAVIETAKPPVAFTGLKHLDHDNLIKGIFILGAPDLVKVLQNLPGVASGMELMSGLYVRGGEGSDNLYLLDGVPVYQVSHLAGLFSSFNTESIKTIDFYKSGFPARYGGKLSSVVDVTTQDGSMERFGGSFSVGLIDGHLSLNGPIIKNKLSYHVSIRRSWLDFLTIPALAFMNYGNKIQTKGKYVLLDANINITYKPSKTEIFNCRMFTGADSFRYGKVTSEKYYGKEIYYADSGDEMFTKWGNLVASSSWSHIFSESSNLNTIVYFTRGYSSMFNWQKVADYKDDIITSNSYSEQLTGNINTIGLKSSLFHILGNHNLSLGIDYQHSWYNQSRFVEIGQDGCMMKGAPENKSYHSNEPAIFIEDEMIFGPVNIAAGLRLDCFFSDGAFYFRPQPRLSASYSIKKDIILKASYERMSQYSHQLSSIYIDLPTNIWMPSTRIIKPSDSHQVSAGIYSRVSKVWHIDICAYYKSINNCLIYSGNGSIFPPVDKWEEKFISGLGRAYGTELEINYLSEKIRASAFYTLSWSERKFTQLYDRWFNDRFDNRHKITFSGSFNIAKGIDLNAIWTYHSGNRVTLPEHSIVTTNGGTDFLYSGPYNAKLPDYHRLDFSCNFRRRTKHSNESIWNISIYNVYCRMNPNMIMARINEDKIPIAVSYSLVPIIPSLSYTLIFK